MTPERYEGLPPEVRCALEDIDRTRDRVLRLLAALQLSARTTGEALETATAAHEATLDRRRLARKMTTEADLYAEIERQLRRGA